MPNPFIKANRLNLGTWLPMLMNQFLLLLQDMQLMLMRLQLPLRLLLPPRRNQLLNVLRGRGSAVDHRHHRAARAGGAYRPGHHRRRHRRGGQ